MNKNRKLLLLVAASALALSACEMGHYERDHAARQAAFEKCMSLLPQGPVVTRYNDWAEVVEACDNVASRQSPQVWVKD